MKTRNVVIPWKFKFGISSQLEALDSIHGDQVRRTFKQTINYLCSGNFEMRLASKPVMNFCEV